MDATFYAMSPPPASFLMSDAHGSLLEDLFDRLEDCNKHGDSNVNGATTPTTESISASMAADTLDAVYAFPRQGHADGNVVYLDPAWSLPRRNTSLDSEPGMVPDLSPSGSSSTSNSEARTPHLGPISDLSMLSQSPPQIYSTFDTLNLALPPPDLSSPSSAPADTYVFGTCETVMPSNYGPSPRQRSNTLRTSPYNPPLFLQPAFQLDLPSDAYKRRRSISMSDATTLKRVHIPPYPRMPPLSRPRRDSSSDDVKLPTRRNREPSRRRENMQNVMAEAKLPSPTLAEQRPRLLRSQSPQERSNSAPILDVAPRQPTSSLVPVSEAPVPSAEAVGAVEVVLAYLDQLDHVPGGGNSHLVTEAHWHLLNDLKCRLRATL